ncbi:hypothetical protein F2Q69_00060309 [Brassica cretica]|uniref:Uncharacterized protein n=1 Tax=Brassica cretica TaxID=69181 RepID=A0A8S9RBT9_BRACR|nr:hypothetical protein F2Q69_00060309 [Brassica cretica]
MSTRDRCERKVDMPSKLQPWLSTHQNGVTLQEKMARLHWENLYLHTRLIYLMFLKVSPSRQDGKISRPVRLAETTKLVSYTDVNSTRHIVQMKLVWSQAMDDGSDRYISKGTSAREREARRRRGSVSAVKPRFMGPIFLFLEYRFVSIKFAVC